MKSFIVINSSLRRWVQISEYSNLYISAIFLLFNVFKESTLVLTVCSYVLSQASLFIMKRGKCQGLWCLRESEFTTSKI